MDGSSTVEASKRGTNPTGTGVGLEIGVGVGLEIGVGVGLEIGAGVGLEIGVGVGAEIGPGVGLEIGPGAGLEIGVGVGTGVGVEICAGVGPGEGVEFSPGVGVEDDCAGWDDASAGSTAPVVPPLGLLAAGAPADAEPPPPPHPASVTHKRSMDNTNTRDMRYLTLSLRASAATTLVTASSKAVTFLGATLGWRCMSDGIRYIGPCFEPVRMLRAVPVAIQFNGNVTDAGSRS